MTIPLTRERLWFLYHVAGLNKSDIEELTGWSRGQIDYRLRKWDLGWFASETYFTTQVMIEQVVAQQLGVEWRPEAEHLYGARRALQNDLRAWVLQRLARPPQPEHRQPSDERRGMTDVVARATHPATKWSKSVGSFRDDQALRA